MKTGWIIAIVILVLLIAIYLYKNKIVVYSLPRSKDPEVFGPRYWNALHGIAEKIPCGKCKNDGTQLMVFMHDLVNQKLEKKIMYPENFTKWKSFICEQSAVPTTTQA